MPDWRNQLRNPDCTACPLHEGAQFVCLMGSGPKRADIFIVGEAPGAREDEEHRAFTGRAGQLLDLTLDQYAGIKRDDCFVSNVVKCRPPENATPDRKNIKICVENYFWEEVKQVQPRFMLLLGNSALQGVLKQSGIMKKAGNVWERTLASVPMEIMATIHPAAVLRNPKNASLFTSDIARFGRLVRGQKTESATKVKIIRTTSQLKWLYHELIQARVISYDIETYVHPAKPPYIRTNFMDWHGKNSWIVSIAFSWKEGHGAVVPLWHEKTPWKDPDAVLAALRPCLTRKNCKYVAHNGKFDARWLHTKGIPIPQTFDTMLAGHMLEENRPKSLKSLSRTILDTDPYGLDEELGNAHKVPLRKLCIYNAKDTDYTLRLYRVFREQLKQDERTARMFIKLMMPASNALVDVERNGVWIDPERWERAFDRATENVDKLYRYINQYVPEDMRPINLNSPPQVGRWLFEHLELPVVELTKAKKPSTKEGVILRLMVDNDEPALKALLKYRKWAKYLSTYILPLWFEHRDKNGRVHSNYKLFGTVTGRISGEGGIQQIPRDPFIRGIFGATPGWRFVQADYSQIELRIAAMVAHEQHMISQFLRGEDIHMSAASKRLSLPPERVSKEQRKKAKARNFGYLYAMGSKKFVNYCFENWDLTITLDEAEKDRKDFFEEYPMLVKWHARQRRLAQRYGVVYSPLGRARHLPDIMSQDKDVRAEAERQAINSPVQSAASDLQLFSLVRLNSMMPRSEARILGSIHDAILFEIREEFVDKWTRIIKEVMEDMNTVTKNFPDFHPTVPIIADVTVSSHWGVEYE